MNVDLELHGTLALSSLGLGSGSTASDTLNTIGALSGTGLVLGANTLTVGATNHDGLFSGQIVNDTGCTASLVKIGTGRQILTGNNTYGGTTTLSAGTLQIGDGGTTGTLGTGAVIDNGYLVFDRSDTLTVANQISGTGTLRQIGTGTSILTANNTYGGATAISAGTLQVGDGGTTGTLGTGAVIDDGYLVFDRSDSVSLSTLAANAAGITGTGHVTALIGGDFTVDRGIRLDGASSAITLAAGVNHRAGDATGGDLHFLSAISTTDSGTITLFQGHAGTAGLAGWMSGATGGQTEDLGADRSGLPMAKTGTRTFLYRERKSEPTPAPQPSPVPPGLLPPSAAADSSRHPEGVKVPYRIDVSQSERSADLRLLSIGQRPDRYALVNGGSRLPKRPGGSSLE